MKYFKKNLLGMIALYIVGGLTFSCKVSREENLPAYKIKKALSSSDDELPETLGETFLFKDGDPSKPAFGVIPYDVKVALWTDSAAKKRYIFVPPEEKISFDAAKESFSFPIGTTLAKHFSTGSGDPIETRIITKKDDDSWAFGTYVWEDGATKLNIYPITVKGGDGLDYRVPSEKECKMCHNSEAIDPVILGFSTMQLGHSNAAINQFDELDKESLFADEIEKIKETQTIDDPNDESLTLDVRARSYLAINCGPCHRPNGAAADKNIDLRYGISLDDTKLVAEGKVVPGKPDQSLLWQKYSATEERMPPLSLRHDPLGSALIKEWIEKWPE